MAAEKALLMTCRTPLLTRTVLFGFAPLPCKAMPAPFDPVLTKAATEPGLPVAVNVLGVAPDALADTTPPSPTVTRLPGALAPPPMDAATKRLLKSPNVAFCPVTETKDSAPSPHSQLVMCKVAMVSAMEKK